MKIKVKEEKEIKLTDKDIYLITIEGICRIHNIKGDYYIKGGNIVRAFENYAGTHSWSEEITVRVATEKDKFAIDLINSIKSMHLKEYK